MNQIEIDVIQSVAILLVGILVLFEAWQRGRKP